MSAPSREMSGPRMVATVTAIAVVAAVALAAVHGFTRESIEINRQRDLLRAVQNVLGLEHPPEKVPPAREIDLGPDRGNRTATIYTVGDSEGRPVGRAVLAYSDRGYGGRISVMVGVDDDGAVRAVQILKHNETPGLGANITGQAFLSQFVGRSPDNFDFHVKKDGGDVDAITAATISSRAVSDAIADALAAVRISKE